MSDSIRVLTRESLQRGAQELAARDDDFAELHGRLGTPPLWGRRPGFATLVRIILEQQVSLVAARTLYRRLQARLGGIEPRRIVAMRESGLRRCGLTHQKSRHCHGLAERVLDGRLDLGAAARGPDEDGRRALLEVPGLGPWSVDVYYLMALRRPDVWPSGDLALAVALREVKRLPGLPSRDEQRALSADWAPWRAVAARMLWAHYLEARGQYSPSS